MARITASRGRRRRTGGRIGVDSPAMPRQWAGKKTTQGEIMKTKRIGLAAAVLACASVPAVAQEHWTEGPVWACEAYRTSPGQFDAYLKYIRTNVEPQNIES